jgi:hypothetical protein
MTSARLEAFGVGILDGKEVLAVGCECRDKDYTSNPVARERGSRWKQEAGYGRGFAANRAVRLCQALPYRQSDKTL